MKLIFAGTPEFALPSLQALAQSRHTICAVYTQPDRPQGRGRRLSPSPIKQFALEKDWPILQPLSLRSLEAQQTLAAWQADLMIVVAYGLILPKAVLTLPKKRLYQCACLVITTLAWCGTDSARDFSR
ncbi:methionyl-tRNA formyltransferase [Rickettsiella massiliensis]|uniref:methionyl-tRNA formyltransferase n=1 Tax=Rickettsiella massiliensis TaxID=676517 RepID=UPI00029AFEA1|nr:formyltransferase family protein [Rickettsiella massiliensis]